MAEKRRQTKSKAGGRILIVDDDPIVAESLSEFLGAEGYSTAVCFNASEALELLREASAPEGSATRRPEPFNIVLTDVSMPGMSGLELVKTIGKEHPSIVPVVLTGYGTIESAVRAIRDGAFDYMSKPVVDDELRMTLERALRQQTLLAENTNLKKQLDTKFGLGSVIGRDYRMAKAFEMIEAVAPSKATVLITGESGTGKSLLARSIHRGSPRASGSFVEIHCGSIPETLLESELFGHVKGAFTGAHADKQGKFLAADGGTIFIDEINSASAAMQLKLLRVLQERKFEPIGSTDTIEVDVRVVLATNQSLEQLVREGTFREDLYYRINVVKIDLPPLRDRMSDIPALVEHFMAKHSAEHGKSVVAISDDAIEAIRRYSFPGNVRELENIIERAVVLSSRPTITADDLPVHVLEGNAPMQRSAADRSHPDDDSSWSPIPLSEALEEPEKRILLKALEANEWNRQKTADDLCINRTTLYKKIKAYGLDKLAG
ncbi:MAG: sigma-54 dependent transcriptional regulator [bacterium]|nr:sigma-54 dependent transcriptional regulator [bacterium]